MTKSIWIKRNKVLIELVLFSGFQIQFWTLSQKLLLTVRRGSTLLPPSLCSGDLNMEQEEGCCKSLAAGQHWEGRICPRLLRPATCTVWDTQDPELTCSILENCHPTPWLSWLVSMAATWTSLGGFGSSPPLHPIGALKVEVIIIKGTTKIRNTFN